MAEALASGTQRIGAAFAAAREAGHAALMPYMMGGFPDHDGSLAVADAYAEGGADLIELGVPFSDPLADGPVIHDAGTKALAAGATLESVLAVCEHASRRVPVVLMVYANMVIAGGGAARFAEEAAVAGASGVIVPDLPLGEAEDVRDYLAAAGLASVPLVAPTTPEDRRREIAAAATGFVYVVADVGTTGERDSVAAGVAGLVEAVRSEARLPVAVGFGIGTPEQVAEVGGVADGVIIGSRLVRAVAEAGSPAAGVAAAREFLDRATAALAG